MFTITNNTEPKKTVPDKDTRLLACLAVGRECWKDYCDSENGMECLKRLPSEDVCERAEDIFLLGFCCRMLVSPPVKATDRMTDEKEFNRLWVEHLHTCGGEIILDGLPFPFTDEIVLRVAKAFFRLGFTIGTSVWRQIRDELRSGL